MLFTTPEPTVKEIKVVQDIETIRKNLQYMLSRPARWYGYLRRSTLAKNIRGSNSIEGYEVTNEDAVAAVAQEEPEEAEQEAWLAVVGYRNAMTYVLQLSKDPHFVYHDGFLKSLHFMMVQHDLRKHPGTWRPGPIYVRDEQKNETVYEGPPAEQVPKLMQTLVEELNLGAGTVPVLIRAAMAHLNLTMIHPFSDGNGRMARCLQTLVLGREEILEPEFCSIEEYLGRNTQEYYAVLANVGQGAWHPENDTRAWVQFCLTAHFRQAASLVKRAREMDRVWGELEIELKRLRLPDRMIPALADAAFGYKVRNSTYRTAAGLNKIMASRDLKILCDHELLVPSGERRGRSYVASESVKAIRERTKEPKVITDPFVDDTAVVPGLSSN